MVITNRDGLAKVLETIIEKRGKGANSLAKECRIDQAQLSRLLRGKLQRVSVLTYKRLLSIALAPELLDRIRGLFLSENAREALSTLADRLAELQDTPESRLGLTPGERSVMKRLVEEHPKLRTALNRFDRTVQKRGHTYERKVAALRAVLEPLNRFYTTLGIERGVHELTDEEQAAFIAHGLERERILLEREPDLVRAQRADGKLSEIKTASKTRTEHFGFGRPFCWDFMKPKLSDVLEAAFSSPGVQRRSDGTKYVDTPSPLFQRSRKKRLR